VPNISEERTLVREQTLEWDLDAGADAEVEIIAPAQLRAEPLCVGA